MVYLLDPDSGTGMSVDHLYLAHEIALRYPEFRLAQVPLNDRTANEEFPFAIVLEHNGDVVKPLRESEMSIRYIFRWLYENDSQRHGAENLYRKFVEAREKAKAEEKEQHKEVLREKLDFVNTLAKSALHTFKHDGIKHNGYRNKDTYRTRRD